MPPAVLSPTLAKRLVADAKKLLPSHSHADHLRAVAAQYGFLSWESLLAACSSSPPTFIYDQDIDEDEFQKRRLDQAKRCRDALGMPLPYAHDFAHAIAATQDFKRPSRPIYVPDAVFEKELLNEKDLWWHSSTEIEHPLCPPKFSLGKASDVRDVARLRLNPPPNRFEGKKLFHIFPGMHVRNHSYRKISSHYYGPRGDLLEVAPVAPAFMFAAQYRVTKKDVREAEDRFHGLNWEEALSSITETRNQYRMLLDAAGIPSRERKFLPQIPIAVKDRMGLPWYWPLVPIISNPAQTDLWNEVEEYAREI